MRLRRQIRFRYVTWVVRLSKATAWRLPRTILCVLFCMHTLNRHARSRPQYKLVRLCIPIPTHGSQMSPLVLYIGVPNFVLHTVPLYARRLLLQGTVPREITQTRVFIWARIKAPSNATTGKFENVALFLYLYRSRKLSFSKSLQIGWICNRGLRVARKHFENGASRNHDVTVIVWFPWFVRFQRKSALFNFSTVVWTAHCRSALQMNKWIIMYLNCREIQFIIETRFPN